MKNTLKALRKAAGLSQQDLADQLGVSRQSIISIERERYDPSLELALKISLVLDEPVAEIFLLEEG
ncbi:MAG: helix-turn-helix transcriptional regulator [Pseudomonadota bacterium]